MSEILKEIITYFIFLMLLLLVAYGNKDPNMYLLRKTLHETFVDLDQLGVDLGDVCIKLISFVLNTTLSRLALIVSRLPTRATLEASETRAHNTRC